MFPEIIFLSKYTLKQEYFQSTSKKSVKKGEVEMRRKSKSGLIFSGNDSNDLARCIKKLSTDKKLYDKMSENARLRFETELNSKSMTDKTILLYEKLFRKVR